MEGGTGVFSPLSLWLRKFEASARFDFSPAGSTLFGPKRPSLPRSRRSAPPQRPSPLRRTRATSISLWTPRATPAPRVPGGAAGLHAELVHRVGEPTAAAGERGAVSYTHLRAHETRH